MVELSDNRSAQPNEPLEEAQNNAAALGEVLDTGDESAGVGEGLGIGADANVETHFPDLGSGDFFGDREPNHEVAEEIENGTDGEDDPGRSDLVDEAREDADVGAEVFEEAEEVEGGLVVS
ncbi:unnamed protein product [Camellia sinensis]